MPGLSGAAVLAHRLRRHQLEVRAPADRLAEVLSRIGGTQAQVQSYGELSLWTRVEGVTSQSVRAALWQHRSLVKTWAMRGTLHFIAPVDFALYKAALQGRRPSLEALFFKHFGLSPAGIADLTGRIIEALAGGEALTRRELAERSGESRLTASWGSLLKPASDLGLVVFGPPRGPETTFVLTASWLGPQQSWEIQAARAELLRRYLRAFGPASPADFARWAGAMPAWGRPAWAEVAGELAEVEVEGRRLWCLASDVDQLLASAESRRLRLLAGFDTWLLGHADRELIFARAHTPRISRTSGWISAIVTVGGRAVGVWTHQVRRSSVDVNVELFERLDRRLSRELRSEAEGLSSFFGRPVRLIG